MIHTFEVDDIISLRRSLMREMFEDPRFVDRFLDSMEAQLLATAARSRRVCGVPAWDMWVERTFGGYEPVVEVSALTFREVE